MLPHLQLYTSPLWEFFMEIILKIKISTVYPVILDRMRIIEL